MGTKVNKTISIDEALNSVTKEMPNFSGFVQHCLMAYSNGDLNIDWNEIDVQSKNKVVSNTSKGKKFGVVEFGAPTKMQYMGVGGSREERERFAGFIPRSCALFTDLLLISLPSLLLGLAGLPFLFVGILVALVYPIAFTASSMQATPGKLLFRMVVTDYDGDRLSLKQSTKRHALIFLVFVTFGFGYVAQVWTDHKQTNQDLMARTLVVRKGMDNWD
tara:strand:+ start:248 stop:901 length:654 start_codon:yes stop_codon:yes gene_type:complete